MNKREIGYFLGKGIDVCVYDSRGTFNSQGYPTEAGLYNDIEVVGEYLVDFYDKKNLCIYGSCGESFSAMHLFAKYHSQGINMILENAPISLDRVLSRINNVAALLFKYEYIRAPNSSECFRTSQDNFNSLEKIKSLAHSNSAGYVILAKTEGDVTSPPEEVDEMARILEDKGNEVLVLNNIAADSLKDGLDDPHLAHPLRNPFLNGNFTEKLFLA